MKKFLSLIFIFAMLISLCSCTANDEKAFEDLREAVADAGYDVSNVFVDSKFQDVVSAFAVKVNFDENTVASIPIILTASESAAKKNCALFGETSIKLPMQNGKIFSYPGKDYPDEVLDLISAIINGEKIPKNLGQ